MNNAVRFVQLRRPIAEILAHDGTTAGAITAADNFRDEIMGLKGNDVSERYRARLVKQGDLWKAGSDLDDIMGRSKADDADTEDVAEEKNGLDLVPAQGKYYGGKWGIYVRAPDLWFKMLDNYGRRFSSLGSVADVRFGVKTGRDSFFYPVDWSAQSLQAVRDPESFQKEYGVRRKVVESGTVKLVRCGEKLGQVRPIEAQYLEPVIHSLMEISRFTISADECRRLVLMVSGNEEELKGSYVAQYIRWGEQNNFHKGATCSGRETEGHHWYDLTSYSRPKIVLPKIQQYRLIAFLNPEKLHENSSLLGIYDVADELVDPLCAILNCTMAILSRINYARILGNEGNIQLDVYAAKMMLVPDIRLASQQQLVRVRAALSKMKERSALAFVSERRLRQESHTKTGRTAELASLSDRSELDMPDRRELDDAVLEMMGVDSAEERRAMIDELYTYLREFFGAVRLKEEKAIVNKNKAKRRGRARPNEIAAEIHRGIVEEEPGLLLSYETDFLDKGLPFDTYELPSDGGAKVYSDMVTPFAVRFMKGAKAVIGMLSTSSGGQAELVAYLANSGLRRLLRVPRDETESLRILEKYRAFVERRDTRLWELVKERSADEETQGEILEALKGMFVGR